jgi:hypothetical protein
MALLPIADIVSASSSPQAPPRLRVGRVFAGDNETMSASLVPNTRQIDAGIQVIEPSVALQRNFTDVPLTRIYHPRQSPSAITSENYLLARAAMNPGFVHNSAHTRAARISNLYRETPRFGGTLDICA